MKLINHANQKITKANGNNMNNNVSKSLYLQVFLLHLLIMRNFIKKIVVINGKNKNQIAIK